MSVVYGPLQNIWNYRAVLVTGLACCVVLTALSVVYTKHQSRTLYAKLQLLQTKRDALHVEWSQLLLEQGTWASDARVEHLAREELGMHTPPSEQIMVLRP